MTEHEVYVGDCRDVLATLPDASVQTVVTSPPYWNLRDYQTGTWDGGDPACDHAVRTAMTRAKMRASSGLEGGKATVGHAQEGYRDICGKCGARRVDRQIGMEDSLQEYVATLVDVFREVRRVLRDDGTLWCNMGDAYATTGYHAHGTASDVGGWDAARRAQGAKPTIGGGIKPKDLLGLPWRVAFALQDDGWYLRSDIVWAKRNCMPESVRDRPTRAHEYLFLLAKRERYFYDAMAIAEPSVYPDDARGKRVSPAQKRVPTDKIAGIRGGERRYPTHNKRDVDPQ